jgi:hypothetical protein
MIKKLVLGTVLGGLTIFVWGALSWMVLPFNERMLLKFTDEEAMTAAIQANAPRSGIYHLPSHEPGEDEAAMNERMKLGPTLFAAVRLAGVDPASPALYLKGLAIEMAGAFLMSALVLTLPGLGYWARVRAVTIVALIAGVIAHLPEWHWWGFSTQFTLTTIFNLVAAWFLTGLVIARFVSAPAAPFRDAFPTGPSR